VEGNRIGVYGTLKRGEANHPRFLAEATELGRAKIRVSCRLFGNHEYPMLIPSPTIHPLVVEVYLVNDALLAALDRFEGQFGYRRETVAPEGEPMELYVHPGPPPPDFEPVPGRDWAGNPAAFAEALRRISG